MRLVVGIATAGRRQIVTELMSELARQTRLPDVVVICPANPEDADPDCARTAPFPIEIVHGERGLPAQRNTILRASRDADVVLFFDDDFVPADDYLEHCAALFERDPSIVMITGQVLADGINSKGLVLAEAKAVLAADKPPAKEVLRPVYCGYGCNMAMRTAPAFANELTFDETLPLYGWLEDVDFSRRLAPYGQILHANTCRGVHMGSKNGRTSGVRLGYSQIANPLYMLGKGSMSAKHAAHMMSRNLLANMGRSLAPEPWVDRRGRLRGNLRALFDLAMGRLDPRAVLTLK